MWAYKGRHNGHAIWVRKEAYSHALIDFLASPKAAVEQKDKQLLLSVPLQ
jgi:hypothetical protein